MKRTTLRRNGLRYARSLSGARVFARQRVLLAWLLLCSLWGVAWAGDEVTETLAEVTVNGPSGAVLRVDGQEMGVLPLLDALRLPAGPHRFRLERGSQRAESDVLQLPGGRQAELNLTFSGRSLVAVLSITPAVLLWMTPEPDATTRRIWLQALSQAAKQEHAVLLSEERQTELRQKSAGLAGCIEAGRCARALFREGELAYVLVLQAKTSPLRLQLLDVRTRDIGADLRADCSRCSVAQQVAQAAKLVRQALGQIAMRARGQLSVTSTPDGAQVRLDGRVLGQTPLAVEAFVGSRKLELERAGYSPLALDVEIEPGKTATLQPVLSRHGQGTQLADAGGSRGRPLWRIVTGATLIGAGALLVGFGGSALAVNGTCQDLQGDPLTCSPYYQTTGVGSGLLAGGLSLAIGGAVLIALPPRRTAPTTQP